jgi:uncharacterized membrane protein YhaH (DUF805 family)
MSFLKELLFSPKGRVSRSKYWLGFLLSMVTYFCSMIIVVILIYLVSYIYSSIPGNADKIIDTSFSTLKSNMELIIEPIVDLFLIMWAYMLFCLSIKRFHDVNTTGWFSLILIIPLVNFFTFITLGCIKGAECENKYGSDPLANKVVSPISQ